MSYDTIDMDTACWTKVKRTLALPLKMISTDQISFTHFSIVVYEGGSVMSQARSLWRLELARTKWSGGFINWYHPMRIRHLTTGRYLGVNENNELILVRASFQR
jgi:hypothetical protein